MKTTEMIEVMQAYERGEQIQYITEGSTQWRDTDRPVWNFSACAYRIKPQPTHRPYKDSHEFLQAQREHGMYIRPINNADRYELPTSVDDEMVVFVLPTNTQNAYSVVYHYENLLADKVWQDGTPCGVKEE